MWSVVVYLKDSAPNCKSLVVSNRPKSDPKSLYRVRKISPNFSCIKFFQIRDVPTQIPGHPGHSLSETTEEGQLHKVFVRDIISRRLGPGCPRNIPPKNFMFRLFFSDLTIKRGAHQTAPLNRMTCGLNPLPNRSRIAAPTASNSL